MKFEHVYGIYKSSFSSSYHHCFNFCVFSWQERMGIRLAPFCRLFEWYVCTRFTCVTHTCVCVLFWRELPFFFRSLIRPWAWANLTELFEWCSCVCWLHTRVYTFFFFCICEIFYLFCWRGDTSLMAYLIKFGLTNIQRSLGPFMRVVFDSSSI